MKMSEWTDTDIVCPSDPVLLTKDRPERGDCAGTMRRMRASREMFLQGDPGIGEERLVDEGDGGGRPLDVEEDVFGAGRGCAGWTERRR